MKLSIGSPQRLRFGGGGGGSAITPQQVFAATLYTGDDTVRKITTGIDLATYGGLVWAKGRQTTPAGSGLFDTARGPQKGLASNATAAELNSAAGGPTYDLYQFLVDGFNVGATYNFAINYPALTTVAWTFRKAAKFFDVVTYTGNGVGGRVLPHNLGIAPGLILIKSRTAAQNWIVYHLSRGATEFATLNLTDAFAASSFPWNDTSPTTADFTLGSSASCNAAGQDYVAYLFAHDTGPNGIIQCGTYTTDGADTATINLGWKPQYILVKRATSAGGWYILDVARGMSSTPGSADQYLAADSTSLESTANFLYTTATGFVTEPLFGPGVVMVYMAIREPM